MSMPKSVRIYVPKISTPFVSKIRVSTYVPKLFMSFGTRNTQFCTKIVTAYLTLVHLIFFVQRQSKYKIRIMKINDTLGILL
jgi:hypothetical protein